MKFFIFVALVVIGLNANSKLYVCYDSKTVSSTTGNLAYLGCKRYHDSCTSNGKLHFGKYPTSGKASGGLNRCLKSSPKFVNNGKAKGSSVSVSTQTATVTGLDPNGDGFLSLRNKPKQREIGKLYNGDKVEILSQSGKYYKVKDVKSGMIGYAHSNWIRKISNSTTASTSTSQKKGTVHGLDPNGDGFLSIRSKPKGKKIGELYNGDKVAILGQRGAWYKVRTSSGLEGWSHGDWVRIEKNKSNNTVKNIANSDEEWWLIFKSYRTSIAKQYNELSLETLNKMATSDTLKKCKDYDETSKVRQLIERMLMTEPLEFAKNRYDEVKNSMPTKEPKKWDKLVKYELALDLQLSGEELELISKYNPGSLMNSLSYLDDCAYQNDCQGVATNLEVLHSDDEKRDISDTEFKIIDKLIMKFHERGCNNSLKKYRSCNDPKKNGCYGYSCSDLARIYGGIDDRGKYYIKKINKGIEISKNMCFKKNNAGNCGVLGDIYITKGTAFYDKAKTAFKKGCRLTNESSKKSTGNICLWCCENYQDLIDKGW